MLSLNGSIIFLITTKDTHDPIIVFAIDLSSVFVIVFPIFVIIFPFFFDNYFSFHDTNCPTFFVVFALLWTETILQPFQFTEDVHCESLSNQISPHHMIVGTRAKTIKIIPILKLPRFSPQRACGENCANFKIGIILTEWSRSFIVFALICDSKTLRYCVQYKNSAIEITHYNTSIYTTIA